MTQEARDATGQINETHDPFANFGLDMLLSGAARLRPNTLALIDGHEALTYASLASRVTSLSHMYLEHGLKRGERIILVGGASNAVIVALVAAVRAGLEPALAPIDISTQDLAAYAHLIDAAALIGMTRSGAFSVEDLYFEAAAEAPSIRLVATLGPEAMDGAVDFGPEVIRRYNPSASPVSIERGKPSATSLSHIFTLRRGEGFAPIMHKQGTLIAAGFDFVNRAKIGRETAILSTLPPTRFATLVAGPVATLLSGAALYLQGPFASAEFFNLLGRAGEAHVIVPAATAAAFNEATKDEKLASLTLVSNLQARDLQLPEEPIDAQWPVIDLYAMDEIAAIPEPRRNGRAQRPAEEVHYIGFEKMQIPAVRALKTTSGGLDLSGTAVTLKTEPAF